MIVKNLVVGCGLAGAVIAERIATQLNQPVLIIDKRPHIAGNIYDYEDTKFGINVHRYGPHVFHTNNQIVWDYLSQFTEWHYFMYRVKAVIDGNEINIPFNLDSLYKVFPKCLADKLAMNLLDKFGFNKKISILELNKTNDKDLKFLANFIYEKVFLGYTIKQWGVKPEDLDESVSSRVPIYISRDNRYFQDKYQAIPLKGYTKMVENILDHPLIDVQLNTDFFDVQNSIKYERLFFTGPIDEFFNYEYGELPYRSLDIQFVEYDKEYFQSGPQINYPENYDYTRSVEYKYYLEQKSHNTIVSFEYPRKFERGINERYYPVPNIKNQTLYDKYYNKLIDLNNVYFLGRLADYKYYNMDQVIERALTLFNSKILTLIGEK
ncbi:UDP-galactopyranose mutase [Gilliamella apis]|uniref:UDP-galactopyranose mutase n=1 Tax=Gilliamella apis TaxID=1970738 RepID=UPI00080DEC04|nr:UDP-galactopyranose mutase [Gilliamella apis]OCG06222.1 UDP-galactopyranose mutase [Gilliamella apis]